MAIITTIAAAHLGNFKNLTEIAAAKSEIMEGVVKTATCCSIATTRSMAG
jgi:UDP-N-acetylmuramyl pentapeptide synthase